MQINICMYACMHACAGICICGHVCMLCVHVCMDVGRYVCYACMYVWMCACMHAMDVINKILFVWFRKNEGGASG
jgi:hypothetical protein